MNKSTIEKTKRNDLTYIEKDPLIKAGLFLGRSEVTRTPGILLPKQARYQLRYTPIFSYEWLVLSD